jgi:hypothetical protein
MPYPVEMLPREVPVIERLAPVTLDDIDENLGEIRLVLGSMLGALHHLLERSTSQQQSIDAISGEAHQTYEIVRSVRAEQVTLAAVLEHARLLRDIHEREVRQRAAAETAPDLSDTERPGGA